MNNFIRLTLTLIALAVTFGGIIIGKDYFWWLIVTPQGQISWLNQIPLEIWVAVVAILWMIAVYSWLGDD
jgi:H+/Cl- antiporter ClcA